MNFSSLVQTIINSVIQPIIALILALSVLYFLMGVLKYIKNSDSEDGRKEGVTMMTYGIIGLFVMGAFGGLVAVLENTFLLDNSQINPPSTTGSRQVSQPGQVSQPSPSDFGPQYGDSVDDLMR